MQSVPLFWVCVSVCDVRKLAEGSKRFVLGGKGFCRRFSYLSEAAGRGYKSTQISFAKSIYKMLLQKMCSEGALGKHVFQRRHYYPFYKVLCTLIGNQLYMKFPLSPTFKQIAKSTLASIPFCGGRGGNLRKLWTSLKRIPERKYIRGPACGLQSAACDNRFA